MHLQNASAKEWRKQWTQDKKMPLRALQLTQCLEIAQMIYIQNTKS